MFLGLSLLFAGSAVQASAKDSVPLYFRINKSEVDASYRSNAASTQTLLNQLGQDSTYNNISRVRVRASASPDGPLAYNRRVSADRASAAVDYIKEQFPSLPESLIEVTVVDEDWNGLASFIKRCSQPWKEEALQIVRSSRTDRKEKLQELYVGEAWDFLRKNYFPLLRKAEVSVEYEAAVPAGELSINGNSLIFAQGAYSIPNRADLEQAFSSLPKNGKISLRASSSPEGKASYNDALAKKRGENVKRLLNALGFSDVSVESVGEDWDGLLSAVKEGYSSPNKEEVLRILEDGSLGTEAKKSAIIALDGGRSWRSMFGREMSGLRSVTWSVTLGDE